MMHNRVTPEVDGKAGSATGTRKSLTPPRKLQPRSSLIAGNIALSNKYRFERRHGKQMADQIKTTASSIAKALHDRENRSKYVLHPEKNKYLNYWDGITTCALIYTATLTPFETAFIAPALGESAWTEPWFIANRALDVIFFVDLFVQFFVAYQT